MSDNMPMEKVDVTCVPCRWRGKRHPYRWFKSCPKCRQRPSKGWIDLAIKGRISIYPGERWNVFGPSEEMFLGTIRMTDDGSLLFRCASGGAMKLADRVSQRFPELAESLE